MFGQMYHHFHDRQMHRPSQGSIDAETFRALIDKVMETQDILSPDDYLSALESRSLEAHHTCLTFDDALRCQFDIALPVMRDAGVTAFFFIYTSILGCDPDPLEFYRDFRHEYFEDIEDFYAAFFAFVRQAEPALHAAYIASFPQDYLAHFVFYSENDRRFRFFRDQCAGPERYGALMDAMMRDAGYSRKRRLPELFMDSHQIAALVDGGHEIGLHSHSHPTAIETLSPDAQQLEYTTNKQILEDIGGTRVRAMSHPCGRYDETTLGILRDLGIRIGFRSSLSRRDIRGALEVPRENHVNLVKELVGSAGIGVAGEAR